MLRRLGLRRILPIVQFALYGMLVGPDSIYLYEVLAENTNPTWEIVALQEGVPFRPTHIDRRIPTGVAFSTTLNFPAVVFGAVVVIPFRPKGTKAELAHRLATAPFVVFQWYVVGLWIDRRLGFVSAKPRAFSKPRLVLWWALYFVSIILLGVLGLGAGGLLIAVFYNLPTLSDVRPAEIGSALVTLLPLAWWAVFFYLVSRSGLRRVSAAALEKT